MSQQIPSPVFIHRLNDPLRPDLDTSQVSQVTEKLVRKLRLRGAGQDPWAVKVNLGSQGRPAAIMPEWIIAAQKRLGGAGRSFAFETLSITSEGLHTEETLLHSARAKGVASGADIDFRVADGTGDQEPELLESPGKRPSGRAAWTGRLAAGLKKTQGCLTLSAVRAHPHLGFQGAMANLSLGCNDRQGKLDLHQDIRPQVDTPLCAGCGSCLAVCLFDAIDMKAGRATINHLKCTGCGECMTVCHLAGIAAESADSLARFQENCAHAAASFVNRSAWSGSGRLGFVNYLVHLDRRQNRSAPRGVHRPKHLGVLASIDPVALDQATWDLINQYSGKDLAAWCGYPQNPETLLHTAQEQGMGNREYHLVNLD